MPKPRKMLTDCNAPYIVSLMRLIETQSKVTIANWCVSYAEANHKEFYLVKNDINRWAIADYTPGLEKNDDGSLDIYIQRCRPVRESNWLPAPKDEFNLVLRMYQPSAKVLNGTYEVPGVRRVTNSPHSH